MPHHGLRSPSIGVIRSKTIEQRVHVARLTDRLALVVDIQREQSSTHEFVKVRAVAVGPIERVHPARARCASLKCVQIVDDERASCAHVGIEHAHVFYGEPVMLFSERAVRVERRERRFIARARRRRGSGVRMR